LSAKEAGKEVTELSGEERVARLKEAFASYDGQALAQSANQFSVMMMAAHGENPDLASETFPAVEAAMSGIDFGKLREAIVALLDYGGAVTSKALEEALANPVIIANLVGALPPLANSLIDLLSVLLENMDLPAEILASALFNVLSALDAGKLGHVLSEISKQVKSLHAGNLILGGDEPRLRAVFTEFTKRVLDNLDADVAARALVALGEDGEIISGVLVDLLSRDPELIDTMAWASVELANTVTRILASALSRAAEWPDEVLAILGKEGRVLDTAELGRAVDFFVTYALRLRKANPGLHKELYTRALQAVNTERVEIHLRAVAGDLKDAAVAHPGISNALEPEEMGRRVNEMLAGFNKSASPAGVKEYLSRLFSAIDSRELEAAVRNIAGGVVDGLFANAKVAKSILKAVASGAWKLTKNMVGLLINR